MDPGLRHVRALRLRSPDEAAARHAAVLVEDALRTASLAGGDGARLVLVRSFALGAIRPDESPPSIALRIEARWRALAADAVHASSPGAGGASAVHFRDDGEAASLLALRIARGADVSAWFWPLAVPGWAAARSRDEGLRAALEAALGASAGPMAAVGLVRTLLRHGSLEPLLSALRSQDGPALLARCGWSRAPNVATRAGDDRLLPPERARLAAHWIVQWGGGDARSLWLACALVAAERRGSAPAARVVEEAVAVVAAAIGRVICKPAPRDDAAPAARRRQADEARVERSPALRTDPRAERERAAEAGLPVVALVRSDDRPVDAGGPSSSSREDGGPVETGGRSSSSRTDGGPVDADATSSSSVDADGTATVPRTPQGRLSTERGGLFFLVRALQQIGFADWLAERPDAQEGGLPVLVLREVARRLVTSADDPVLLALGEPPDPADQESAAAVARWRRALRRHVRRGARIGFHDLVCRRAQIAFTDTHVDVWFRLDRADVRVRRAGFDVDPGWVPWLGRVLQFHYVAGEGLDG